MIPEERPDPAAATGPADRLLTTGVFARRSWLSMKALRLYDRRGLLRPAHVDGSSGYRRYRESQLATARLIAMLRRLDMSLAQIAAVVSAPGPRRAELVDSHWEAVERRIASQRELAAHLRTRLSGAQRSFEMYEIQQRDVPEQVVLVEQRHVLVDELPDWLRQSIGRLARSAERYGGMAGPVSVLYHGQVSQDSDGPVEVCVPVPLAETSPDLPMRREPAHHEVYVRIRKAQVEYPQILSAYDAVSQWAGANGREVTGSPREVYFTDFGAAGPADEVCDVALPIR